MPQHTHYTNFYVPKHPLIAHKLSLLRNKETPNKIFRELVEEITLLLGYEATKDLRLITQPIETPLAKIKAPHLATTTPVILPILRAGLGMVNGLLKLIPTAKVGHIGLYRDETTLKPQHYYFKIPQGSQQLPYIICDPMLATGGSSIDAVSALKKQGVRDIHFICLLAAPEGVDALTKQHPDVIIIAGSLDEKLNDHAYIVPGLGDAGDRLFGTQ